jgi:hypothetical protein
VLKPNFTFARVLVKIKAVFLIISIILCHIVYQMYPCDRAKDSFHFIW